MNYLFNVQGTLLTEVRGARTTSVVAWCRCSLLGWRKALWNFHLYPLTRALTDARVEVAGGASDSRYWPLHQAAAPQRGSTSPRRCSLGVSFPVRDHIRSVSFGLFVTPHRLHLLALFLHS